MKTMLTTRKTKEKIFPYELLRLLINLFTFNVIKNAYKIETKKSRLFTKFYLLLCRIIYHHYLCNFFFQFEKQILLFTVCNFACCVNVQIYK